MFSKERPFSSWKLEGLGGAPALLFETIDSTHTMMKANAKEMALGTLVVANQQEKGRGRHERTWSSPANKNLYFNILVPLEGIPSANFAQITQVTALTFAEVFNSLGAAVTVKWPNDILFEKSKFCGVLAEIVIIPKEGNPPSMALSLGVGINVNSDPEEYASIGRPISSLKSITGKSINRELLLRALVAALDRALGQFRQFGISPWIASWRKMDKFIGARGTVVVNNRCTDENRNNPDPSQKKTGCILDMKDDGSLLFKTDDGEIINVISADLEI